MKIVSIFLLSIVLTGCAAFSKDQPTPTPSPAHYTKVVAKPVSKPVPVTVTPQDPDCKSTVATNVTAGVGGLMIPILAMTKEETPPCGKPS